MRLLLSPIKRAIVTFIAYDALNNAIGTASVEVGNLGAVTSWYSSDGVTDGSGESWGEPGYVTYYTNAARTTQTTKTFRGPREHLNNYNPAPCLSFTHYGIISVVNASPCTP